MKTRREVLENSLPAIVDSVGMSNFPANLDRSALATDIYRVYAAYHYVLDVQIPTREAVKLALENFAKEVKRFRIALKSLNDERNPALHILALATPEAKDSARLTSDRRGYDTLSTLYGGVYPMGTAVGLVGTISNALSEVEALIDAYEKQEKAFEKGMPLTDEWFKIFNPSIRSIGAEAYLCSKLLPEVYEKHFHRKIGVSRTDGKPDGPGLRFIERTLLELDIASSKTGRTLGREAIAAHIKNRRKAKDLPPLDEIVPLAWIDDLT